MFYLKSKTIKNRFHELGINVDGANSVIVIEQKKIIDTTTLLWKVLNMTLTRKAVLHFTCKIIVMTSLGQVIIKILWRKMIM